MKHLITVSGCLLASVFTWSQNVGIGTLSPLLRLSLDSSILIDQNNTNTGGLQPGLIFGAEMKTGITSNKTVGSVIRNGLSFFTGNVRRMSIDSVGNVGINTLPLTDYRLTVSGTSYISNLEVGADLTVNSTAYVFARLMLGTSTLQNARLYLKGRSGTPNNWGQHIVMEATSSTDSAAILYDTDGMKFRNFTSGNQYYFRNESNGNLARIDGDGNFFAGGNITAGGLGIVQNSSATQLKVYNYTSPANLNFSLNVGNTVSFNIGYSGANFTSIPTLLPGQLTGGTGFNNLLITAVTVDLDSAVINIRNVGTSQATATNATFKCLLIGNK